MLSRRTLPQSKERLRICGGRRKRVQCEPTLRGHPVAKAKGRISVNKTRGFLYLLAKLLGDFQAARKRLVMPRGLVLPRSTREKQ